MLKSIPESGQQGTATYHLARAATESARAAAIMADQSSTRSLITRFRVSAWEQLNTVAGTMVDFGMRLGWKECLVVLSVVRTVGPFAGPALAGTLRKLGTRALTAIATAAMAMSAHVRGLVLKLATSLLRSLLASKAGGGGLVGGSNAIATATTDALSTYVPFEPATGSTLGGSTAGATIAPRPVLQDR